MTLLLGPGYSLLISYLSPFSLLSFPDALLTEGSLRCPSFPDGGSCKEKEWWGWTDSPYWGGLSSLYSCCKSGRVQVPMEQLEVGTSQWCTGLITMGSPSGDQHLPLETVEVPLLLTSITCQPGYRYLTHFLKGVPGTLL